MADAKSLISKCSLRIVRTSTLLSARRCVSCANRHFCVLRTMEGPRVSIVLAILVFRLVASLGKYAFRIEYRIRIYLLIAA